MEGQNNFKRLLEQDFLSNFKIGDLVRIPSLRNFSKTLAKGKITKINNKEKSVMVGGDWYSIMLVHPLNKSK